MRAPLSWIREFTPVEAPPAEIADALNQLGLEVEAIDEPGREINGVVVATILDVVPHPDADRIRLADVDFGDGQLRVVCGAPNIDAGHGRAVRAGRRGPARRLQDRTPQDPRRRVRGDARARRASSGSATTTPASSSCRPTPPLGTDVREVLGLDDVVFDLSITPNRPDAMGVIGVARELAALLRAAVHRARARARPDRRRDRRQPR